MVLEIEHVAESSGGLVKHRLLGPTLTFLTQKIWGGDPRICISNKFPGDADDRVPGTTL